MVHALGSLIVLSTYLFAKHVKKENLQLMYYMLCSEGVMLFNYPVHVVCTLQEKEMISKG